MPESFFTILNTNQTVKVNVDYFNSSHDKLHAYLGVHVSFLLQTTIKDTAFDLLPVNARLYLHEPQQLLSTTVGHRTESIVNRETKPAYHLNFCLDHRMLHFIEKHRDKDLALVLELDIHALIKSAITGTGHPRVFSFDHTHSEQVKIFFHVPRSIWVEKLLPNMAFRNLKLFEVPTAHDSLKEVYDHTIENVNAAEKYFNMHDYNQCVGHLRKAIDGLNYAIKNAKPDIDSKSNYKWLEVVNEETRDWLTKLTQSTFSITSKPHHAGPHKEFTRYEAEAIYLVVLGLLNYIGNLPEPS